MTPSVGIRRQISFVMAMVAIMAFMVGPASGQTPSTTPDTPFKLATFEANGRLEVGLVLENRLYDLAAANAYLAKTAKVAPVTLATEMRALIEQYGAVNGRLYQIANYFKDKAGQTFPFAWEVGKVAIKAPVMYPANLLCAAANYRAHAEGMGNVMGGPPAAAPPTQPATTPAAPARPGGGGFNAAAAALVNPDRDPPIMFAKSPRSCIIASGEPYYIAEGRDRMDWEGELAIVIGKPSYMVTKDKAHDAVFGYSIMYDVSDRGGRKREVSMFTGANWFEGKSVDRGAPFGPFIVPKEFLPNFENLRIVTKVNGVVKQDGNSGSLIWKERHLIEYLTTILTLYPGDVISTGTPSGTGMERQEFLKPGDVVTIEIEGIGTLTTPMKSAADRPRESSK